MLVGSHHYGGMIPLAKQKSPSSKRQGVLETASRDGSDFAQMASSGIMSVDGTAPYGLDSQLYHEFRCRRNCL